MERALTVEEKIRRAEQIYARRQGIQEPIRIKQENNKKDIKLLKKMVIQIIVCTLIYSLVYVVQNSNYIFSEDFINKVNQILSYDTNFGEIYNNAKNQINNLFNTNQNKKDEDKEETTNTQDNNINGIGGAEEEVNQEQENQEENNQNLENQGISQEEQDIINVKNTTTFIKPIEGTISSVYGQREPTTATVPKNHTGIDIAANMGTKIKSATNGEVVLSSEEGDYGKHLKIQIGEVSIIYAHCNALYVKQGDQVVQGQEIAEVGSTGNSTGPHLHFEIRISERTVDPQKMDYGDGGG